MTQLTAAQQRVYDFVREELLSGRSAPSVREIAAHFGWTSTRGTAGHLNRLIASGWLISQPRKGRSLQLVQKVETPLPSLRVPIFVVVPKGFGVSRYREADEFLPVTVDMIGFKPTRHTFALRVKDDSMIGKHLCAGDIVVLEHGVWARFIELAGEINASMPRYVVDKTAEALNDAGKSVSGARVLVLGLSYKANIDDDRESPSFEILELLKERGAEIAYCDPYVPVAKRVRKFDIGLTSIACRAERFAEYDAVVISTAHEAFKDPALYRDVKIVVDTRNIVPAAAVTNGRLYKA